MANPYSLNKKSWLDQVRADADRLTKSRMEDGAPESHTAKEDLVNTQEGVTVGTPVREAALVNPSEPDLANFEGDAESALSGKSPKAPSKTSNTPNNQTEEPTSSAQVGEGATQGEAGAEKADAKKTSSKKSK